MSKQQSRRLDIITLLYNSTCYVHAFILIWILNLKKRSASVSLHFDLHLYIKNKIVMLEIGVFMGYVSVSISNGISIK